MLVVVRGAGDIASGIAVRLHRSGASIVMLDVAVPTSVRRTVCFSEAVRLGEAEVEGIRAVRCESAAEAAKVAATGTIAVLVDPKGTPRGRAFPSWRPRPWSTPFSPRRTWGPPRTWRPW